MALLPEFRPIGGTGNNLVNPALNSVPGTPEIALAPLTFSPGTADGLISAPNARLISNVIAGGTGSNGVNAQTDDATASAWVYVFGQFLDHDISLEASPPTATPISITVPAGDTVFTAGTSIPMTRCTRSTTTNTILNMTAGYLDLSQLYGSDTATAASLRNADGTLISTNNGQNLTIVNNQFVTGDPRVMENPELSAVTTLFMREHNWWVHTLAAQHGEWTGDQLYNMAKAITTAEYENIAYTEYLPMLVGSAVGPYRGYDPTMNAEATQEFTAAAFRVGHSEVSDTQEGIDNFGNAVFTQALSAAFFNTASQDVTNGIDPLLRSMGVDFSQATDVYTVSVLRNLLFAPLPGGDVDQIDLIAIDIQRERDAGTATLNQTRQSIGLKPYKSFAQLTSDPVLQASLAGVYGSVDNVDLFMGGLAENHAHGALVGTTFQTIIADQFAALRAGDRFFWQNEPFDPQTASVIANTTLADILLRNTDTTSVQPNLFVEHALTSHVKVHVAPR